MIFTNHLNLATDATALFRSVICQKQPDAVLPWTYRDGSLVAEYVGSVTNIWQSVVVILATHPIGAGIFIVNSKAVEKIGCPFTSDNEGDEGEEAVAQSPRAQ